MSEHDPKSPFLIGKRTERRSDPYSRTEKLDRWPDTIVRLDGDVKCFT